MNGCHSLAPQRELAAAPVEAPAAWCRFRRGALQGSTLAAHLREPFLGRLPRDCQVVPPPVPGHKAGQLGGVVECGGAGGGGWVGPQVAAGVEQARRAVCEVCKVRSVCRSAGSLLLVACGTLAAAAAHMYSKSWQATTWLGSKMTCGREVGHRGVAGGLPTLKVQRGEPLAANRPRV